DRTPGALLPPVPLPPPGVAAQVLRESPSPLPRDARPGFADAGARPPQRAGDAGGIPDGNPSGLAALGSGFSDRPALDRADAGLPFPGPRSDPRAHAGAAYEEPRGAGPWRSAASADGAWAVYHFVVGADAATDTASAPRGARERGHPQFGDGGG